MVNRCCAPNCDSRTKQGCGISFHRFPLHNEFLLNKWIQAVKRAEWKPTKWSVLCSQHFDKMDFYPDQSLKQLREDAVPTIFDYPPPPPPVKKRPSPKIRKPSKESCEVVVIEISDLDF